MKYKMIRLWTRMKTSISSKAFVALPTDRQNIYRIDAHLCGESAQKKWSDISIRGRENHVSP